MPTSDSVGLLLEALLDAVFGSIIGGFGRRRDGGRPLRPVVRVDASAWHRVIAAALLAQGAMVAVGVVRACAFALMMLNDDLLWVLGIILLPGAVLALAAGSTVIGWLIRGARRILARDARGRIHAGAAGAGGLVLAMLLLMTVPGGWGVIAAVPSVVAVAGASSSGAWRAVDPLPEPTSVSDG